MPLINFLFVVACDCVIFVVEDSWQEVKTETCRFMKLNVWKSNTELLANFD